MGSNVMGPQWKVSYHIQQLQGPSKFRWLTFELLLSILLAIPRVSVLGIIYLCVQVLLIIHLQ